MGGGSRTEPAARRFRHSAGGCKARGRSSVRESDWFATSRSPVRIRSAPVPLAWQWGRFEKNDICFLPTAGNDV